MRPLARKAKITGENRIAPMERVGLPKTYGCTEMICGGMTFRYEFRPRSLNSLAFFLYAVDQKPEFRPPLQERHQVKRHRFGKPNIQCYWCCRTVGDDDAKCDQ